MSVIDLLNQVMQTRDLGFCKPMVLCNDVIDQLSHTCCLKVPFFRMTPRVPAPLQVNPSSTQRTLRHLCRRRPEIGFRHSNSQCLVFKHAGSVRVVNCHLAYGSTCYQFHDFSGDS